MSRGWKILGAIAFAIASLAVVPAALAATPRDIYVDYARDGQLDQRYSEADLQRALGYAALQGYPRVGFKGAVEQALAAQAVKSTGGLPFTGLDLALMAAGGAALVVAGTLLVKIGHQRK